MRLARLMKVAKEQHDEQEKKEKLIEARRQLK